MLLTGAAVFVAVYALAAAWIVVTGDDSPEPLGLERTADARGVIVTGAVADEADRAALIDAIGDATGAAAIISDLEIDPDAPPIGTATATARELVASLPPDPG